MNSEQQKAIHYTSFERRKSKIVMKFTYFKLFLLIFINCKNVVSNKSKLTHIVDTDSFLIEVPLGWEYKKQKGVDSFVGQIIGKNVEINFDYSGAGYANSLLPTEIEYLEENEIDWKPFAEPYYKSDVIYTFESNVAAVKEEEMRKQGITDANLIKVEVFQKPRIKFERIKSIFSNADFLATLEYKDTTVRIKVKIPPSIKHHSFEIDTFDSRYYRKLIYPKSNRIKDKITGIYIKDMKSKFNFNMYALNLSAENQEKAIKAFRSIQINRK